MANLTLYSKPEYFEDVVERIAKTRSGDRVSLATMSFDPEDPYVARVLHELAAAARRDVHTRLSIDAWNFLSDNTKLLGPLFYQTELPRKMPNVFKDKLLTIEHLQTSGVATTISNMPRRRFLNPASGRSHIKFALINNYFYIGGCNLDRSEYTDVMVGCNDKKTADYLYEFSKNMQLSNGTSFMHGRDVQLNIDDETTLLIDSGVRKQSVIYDEALKLINRARKTVFITCQFFPNTVTAKHLLGAHQRGANVDVVFNHPSQHEHPKNLVHHVVVARERIRVPEHFFEKQLRHGEKNYIHAKVLTNEGQAIVGSHNFVTHGVNFGTAEIALRVRNPVFARRLEQKILSLVE